MRREHCVGFTFKTERTRNETSESKNEGEISALDSFHSVHLFCQIIYYFHHFCHGFMLEKYPIKLYACMHQHCTELYSRKNNVL